MSALADEVREAVRQAIREELPRVLAELQQATSPRAGDMLVGVEAAARRLGLAKGTVYKMAEKCELPSHKIKGRLLFSPADLDTYADARRRSPEIVAQLAARSEQP